MGCGYQRWNTPVLGAPACHQHEWYPNSSCLFTAYAVTWSFWIPGNHGYTSGNTPAASALLIHTKVGKTHRTVFQHSIIPHKELFSLSLQTVFSLEHIPKAVTFSDSVAPLAKRLDVHVQCCVVGAPPGSTLVHSLRSSGWGPGLRSRDPHLGWESQDCRVVLS